MRGMAVVALLAEGVDRNKEINALFSNIRKVALLAEGVDRNPVMDNCYMDIYCRPPRGGRG